MTRPDGRDQDANALSVMTPCNGEVVRLIAST
jgi:hypothetical protein